MYRPITVWCPKCNREANVSRETATCQICGCVDISHSVHREPRGPAVMPRIASFTPGRQMVFVVEGFSITECLVIGLNTDDSVNLWADRQVLPRFTLPASEVYRTREEAENALMDANPPEDWSWTVESQQEMSDAHDAEMEAARSAGYENVA